MYLLDISYLIDLIRGRPEAVKIARKIEGKDLCSDFCSNNA